MRPASRLETGPRVLLIWLWVGVICFERQDCHVRLEHAGCRADTGAAQQPLLKANLFSASSTLDQYPHVPCSSFLKNFPFQFVHAKSTAGAAEQPLQCADALCMRVQHLCSRQPSICTHRLESGVRTHPRPLNMVHTHIVCCVLILGLLPVSIQPMSTFCNDCCLLSLHPSSR